MRLSKCFTWRSGYGKRAPSCVCKTLFAESGCYLIFSFNRSWDWIQISASCQICVNTAISRRVTFTLILLRWVERVYTSNLFRSLKFTSVESAKNCCVLSSNLQLTRACVGMTFLALTKSISYKRIWTWWLWVSCFCLHVNFHSKDKSQNNKSCRIFYPSHCSVL